MYAYLNRATAAAAAVEWMDALFEQHFKMLNMDERQRIIACLFIERVECMDACGVRMWIIFSLSLPFPYFLALALYAFVCVLIFRNFISKFHRSTRRNYALNNIFQCEFT